MSYDLSLGTEDARLIYLALTYHLARPGADIDPQTLKQTEHGLLEAAQALHPQLNQSMATLSLSASQMGKLGQAMLSVINELKAYPMLRAQSDGKGAVSAASGFDDMLLALFPDLMDDENGTLDVAQDMMLLRRRMDAIIQEAVSAPADNEPASPEAPPRKGWQFWRRS